MGATVVYVTKKDEKEMVKELHEKLKGQHLKAILYFVSMGLDIKRINHEMKETFGDVSLFGCSSGDEMATGHMLKHSIVAMAFDDEVIEDLKVEVVENIKTDYEKNLEKAFKNFETYYGEDPTEMDYKKYVGLSFIDGNSLMEEQVIEKISGSTNVLFAGASASDEWKFEQTYVFANGKTYDNAALLVLMKPKKEFEIIKTQSFKSTGKKVTVTKVDEEVRAILELDGRPANEVYAEKMGVPLDKVAEQFPVHPFGLMTEDEIFVRSPALVFENGGLKLACTVLVGMELEILESTGLLEKTKEDISHLKDVTGLIHFNCALRAMELAQKGLVEEYIDIFSHLPNIGFTCYGETYLGHMNQTSVMLVFK